MPGDVHRAFSVVGQLRVLGADHRAARVGRGQEDDQGGALGKVGRDLAVRELGVEALPVAFRPGAGIRRVVELRRGDRHLRVHGRRRLAVGDGEVADLGERLALFEHAVDEEADLLRGPALGMSVRHPDRHAERARALHEPVRLPIAVQRIGEVVRAVDEEDRGPHARQVARGVEVRHPPIPLLGPHLLESGEPGAVLVEEAAAVDRHGDLQPVVDPRDDARQVAAPADAGDADPVAVDLLPARRRSAWPRSTAATAW